MLDGDANSRAQGSDAGSTALVLVGYQNEFFARTGALRDAFEDTGTADAALAATVDLISATSQTPLTIVSVPICFSEDYHELADPVGVLARIQAVRAFQAGSPGAGICEELLRFGDRVEEVAGRHGFSAFGSTGLQGLLDARGTRDVLVAGALTSLCVDSTVRAAVEHGFRTSVVRDCSVGRTRYEHDYFCERLFPMYATVTDSQHIIRMLAGAAA
ncbi:MAG TPA: cysteine hydrolase [Acidimicrobiales bacterium]|nr:cysteine hydrolase [Acidimicrobiales bacterium]